MNQQGSILGYDITCRGISDPAHTQDKRVLPVKFTPDFLIGNEIIPKDDSNPFVQRQNRLILMKREGELESVIDRKSEDDVDGTGFRLEDIAKLIFHKPTKLIIR